MLIELRVENLVIVPHAVLTPGEGLTVITGETGAGKSLLLDAIDLVSGARAKPDLVGPWGPSALVCAVFHVPEARQLLVEQACGIPGVEGQFILRRRIGAKPQAWINDTPVTVAALRAAADRLIALHAQHEPIRLADPAVQMELLDAFGGLSDMAAGYRTIHDGCLSAEQALRTIESGERSSVKELEFLNFQLQEFTQLDPKPGELAELEARSELLSSADHWRTASARVADELDGGDQAMLSRIGKMIRRLETAPDQRLQGAASALVDVQERMRDAAAECRSAADAIASDPLALAATDERINAIQSLIRKHGASEGDLHVAWSDLRSRVAELSGLDERREQLRASVARLRAQREQSGGALAAARTAAFARLAAVIHGHLAELGMPKASVQLLNEEGGEPGSLGTVAQSMRVCTNPGSRPGSIKDVASGGEAARLMLAISAALAEVDAIPVIIYDEVDAGIGGRLGGVIGGKLARIACGRSVLAVTHTPQLAAHGRRHVHVRKHQGQGETRVAVESLTGAVRLHELAEMLGGGDAAERQAESLLQGIN